MIGRARAEIYTPSLKAAGGSGGQTGDLVPATRAAGSLGPLGTPSPPGACNDLERANEQSQRDVSVYQGAFPIGDEILLHWVSAGTEGKEVLLYLASLAFLWTPWSLSLDDENVCKLL